MLPNLETNCSWSCPPGAVSFFESISSPLILIRKKLVYGDAVERRNFGKQRRTGKRLTIFPK
nr:MAG TPA: 4Fe-4S binding domain protein [Caudoviricetes sp.]